MPRPYPTTPGPDQPTAPAPNRRPRRDECPVTDGHRSRGERGADLDQAGASAPAPAGAGDDTLERLLAQVARSDEQAFAELYQRVAAAVFGLVSKVVRNPAQSEEVTQEVFVELWRTAPRFALARGTARSWIMTCAHRRAVDRVRSAESAARRDDLAGRRDQGRPYDEVVEQVEASLERGAV